MKKRPEGFLTWGLRACPQRWQRRMPRTPNFGVRLDLSIQVVFAIYATL